MPDQYQLSQDDLNRFSAESHQQASPETSSLQELRPLPWWKRYLMGELEEKSQSAPVSGGSSSSGYDPVKTYENLGKGAGKGLRVLLGGGMADGGAVQGPTQVLIGEGGEPEYVLPQSKVAPWIAATLRSGAPPNPANVPRAEPPPPVILPPQMCNGGKVMPHMKDGGKVLPILLGIGGGVLANSGMFGGLGGQLSSLGMDMLRQQLLPSDDKGLPAMANGGMVLPPYQDPSALNPDDPRYGQFEPEAPFASGPGFEMPPTPASAQQSVPRPALPRVAPPELAARQKYQDLIAKGPPQGAWYDRLFASREGGGGPMDMRPGVAPYSIAGRAAGRVIGSLLPINKKREAYGRDVAAAKVGMDTEAAQIAAAQRADAENRARVVAESQMSADEARRLSEEARLRKLNTPPPPVDPYKDMIEVTPEVGAKAGVAAGSDGKFRLPKSAVRVPVEKPPQRPQQPTAASLAAIAANPQEPEAVRNAAAAALKLLKPPKAAAGGVAAPAAGLSAEDERTAQYLADGKTAVEKIKSKNRDAIVNRAIELGYNGSGSSASDAKIGGIVDTLPSEIEKLRQILKNDYRRAVAGYQAGSNRELVRLIDNVADKVGRLRSGGAINKEEEARFIRQLGVEKSDLVWGDSSSAEKALDGVLAETTSVKGRMRGAKQGGSQPSAQAPQATQPPSDAPGGMVEMLWPGGATRKVRAENVAAAEKSGAKRK